MRTAPCPHCGNRPDFHRAVIEPQQLRADGDLAVCDRCLRPSVFDVTALGISRRPLEPAEEADANIAQLASRIAYIIAAGRSAGLDGAGRTAAVRATFARKGWPGSIDHPQASTDA